jgi:hypothetical protein
MIQKKNRLREYFDKVFFPHNFTLELLWETADPVLLDDFLKLVTGVGSDRCYWLCKYCWGFGDVRSFKKVGHKAGRSMSGLIGYGLGPSIYKETSRTLPLKDEKAKLILFKRLIDLAGKTGHLTEWKDNPWPMVFGLNRSSCINNADDYDHYAHVSKRNEDLEGQLMD